MRGWLAVAYEDHDPVTTRPLAAHPCGPTDAGRAGSPQCDSPGCRWWRAHRARGHRAAPLRADSAAQQSAVASGDAVQPLTRGETDRRLRLHVSAIAPARADRE